MNLSDILAQIRAKDPFYSSGRILSSMVTTPDSVAVKAFYMFIDTNAGDYGVFKNLAKMEKYVIGKLSQILGCVSNECGGYIVSGGSEANFLSLWLLRNLALKMKNIRKPETIVSPTVHYSILKAANALNIRVVYSKLNKHLKMDVTSIQNLVTKRTIAIVANAGSTELGFVDDLNSISKVAYENEVPIHVDAAYGGFILPFIKTVDFQGFRLESVYTITADPHKTLFTPIPSGGFFVKNRKILKYIRFAPKYLNHKPSETLTGTRSGGAIASVYAILRFVGLREIAKIHRKCYKLALDFYRKIKRTGKFKTFGKPETPIVCFKPFDTDSRELIKALRRRGWIIYRCPVVDGLRMVFMPHVTKDVIEEFLDDLLEIV